MAGTKKSPRTVATRKSPTKPVRGTIRKITPLRKTKTPTMGATFRSTRRPASSNVFTKSVIANRPASSTTSSKSPKITLGGRTTPGRTTPGRTPSRSKTPVKATPGRTPSRSKTPVVATPVRKSPVRKSPRTISTLKPKSPTTRTPPAPALGADRQFLYITLSICAGLILFVLILFIFYKLYEYFNPTEETTSDSLSFLDDLETEQKQETTTEETPDEETTTTEDPVNPE